MPKPLSLFKLSQTVICNGLWGFCKEQEDDISLALHRQISEKKLNDLNLSVSLSSAILQGLMILEQVHYDAFAWLKIYGKEIETLKRGEVNIIHDKKYRFSNFITPDGNFDDLNWVLLFIDDKQRRYLDRFFFACFYCLEQKIRRLWKGNQKNGWYRKVSYASLRSYKSKLVNFWLHYLEETHMVLYANNNLPYLLNRGFSIAIKEGHVKAAHYFWSKLSRRQRTLLLNDLDDYVNRITAAVRAGYLKIVHFLYSQLSRQNQKSLLRDHSYLWWCYLDPSLISFIPKQITLFQNVLPNYSYVMCQLAGKMKELGSAFYKEMFRTFWEQGSIENKNNFLQSDQQILTTLLPAKELTCITELLKNVSLKEKKLWLYESVKNTLIGKKDISGIRNYLLVYLTDFNQDISTSNLLPFHADSLGLLKEFSQRIFKYYPKYASKENVQFLLWIIGDIILEIETSSLLIDLLKITDEKLLETSREQCPALSSEEGKQKRKKIMSAIVGNGISSTSRKRLSPSSNQCTRKEGSPINKGTKKRKLS